MVHGISSFDLDFTDHGREQAVRRGIGNDEIRAALLYGHRQKSYDAFKFTVGRLAVAWAARHGIDISRCLGVTVVATGDDLVITVYRDSDLVQGVAA